MVRSAVALTLGSLTSAALLPGERDLTNYGFEEYKQEFGKLHSSNEEHDNRKAIFQRNMEMIRAHNAQEDKTWFATVNEFADWENDEFRAHRTGHRPSRQGARVSLSANLGDLPDRIDWREQDGVVTPVKNQASCGSCWAFSAVQTLESHLAIATGEAAPVLSPQQVVSCAPNPDHCGGTGGCKGSTQPLAFNYTANTGLSLNSDYPYTSSIGITGKCKPEKIKPVAQNDGVDVLETNDYTALITAVSTKGPVSISVAAGGLGWQLYGGGVYSKTGALGCNYVVDHAVQLVGHGTDSGKMYWLVRNSWGGSWGESGYMRVERFGEGNEPCGMDNKPQDGMACEGDDDPIKYCGLCGILSSSSYPTGVKKVGSETVV
jgi:cathepsin L